MTQNNFKFSSLEFELSQRSITFGFVADADGVGVRPTRTAPPLPTILSLDGSPRGLIIISYPLSVVTRAPASGWLQCQVNLSETDYPICCWLHFSLFASSPSFYFPSDPSTPLTRSDTHTFRWYSTRTVPLPVEEAETREFEQKHFCVRGEGILDTQTELVAHLFR
jgi:hypothetical protein